MVDARSGVRHAKEVSLTSVVVLFPFADPYPDVTLGPTSGTSKTL